MQPMKFGSVKDANHAHWVNRQKNLEAMAHTLDADEEGADNSDKLIEKDLNSRMNNQLLKAVENDIQVQKTMIEKLKLHLKRQNSDLLTAKTNLEKVTLELETANEQILVLEKRQSSLQILIADLTKQKDLT